jgi:hypothetical protein
MLKRLTTEEFVERSIKKHGDQYDYSLSNYINAKIGIKIICKRHGVFKQLPHTHMRGAGCLDCAIELIASKKRKGIKDFIENVNKLYKKDLYDYSHIDYVDRKTKISPFCNKHKKFFSKTPMKMLQGHGCPDCGREKQNKSRRKTQEQFLREILAIDSPYDFSKFIYSGHGVQSVVICEKHGEWSTTPASLLKNKGCLYCANENRNNKKVENAKMKFFTNMKKIFPEYDFSQFNYYRKSTHGTVVCPDHGSWETSPTLLVNSRGCPTCNKSKGERRVQNYLDLILCSYETQKRFINCKNERELPIDFFIPDYNMLIEYQGEQHYKPVQFGSMKSKQAQDAFKETRFRDKIKRRFCKDYGIILIEIPYWDYNKVELILENNFAQLSNPNLLKAM